jgi:hypothetical protein
MDDNIGREELVNRLIRHRSRSAAALRRGGTSGKSLAIQEAIGHRRSPLPRNKAIRRDIASL